MNLSNFIIFIFIILIIILSIDYYNKENFDLFVVNENNEKKNVTPMIIDVSNNRISILTNMFKDINYCNNLNEMSYVKKDNQYYLLDEDNFYNKYKEGFENRDIIYDLYYFMIGFFIILLLYKYNHEKL
tara:strand:- start:1183 stop:1569 length:387 start_codon:yes stop_codon:yes gene_type:complete